MKRFCVAPIVGTGTRQDPFRAPVPLGMAHSAHIPTNEIGHPIGPDALIWVEISEDAEVAKDQLKQLAEAGIEVLPSENLDAPVESVVKAMGHGKFHAFGAMDDDPTETFRDYLVALARRHEYEFDGGRLNEMLGVTDDD